MDSAGSFGGKHDLLFVLYVDRVPTEVAAAALLSLVDQEQTGSENGNQASKTHVTYIGVCAPGFSEAKQGFGVELLETTLGIWCGKSPAKGEHETGAVCPEDVTLVAEKQTKINHTHAEAGRCSLTNPVSAVSQLNKVNELPKSNGERFPASPHEESSVHVVAFGAYWEEHLRQLHSLFPRVNFTLYSFEQLCAVCLNENGSAASTEGADPVKTVSESSGSPSGVDGKPPKKRIGPMAFARQYLEQHFPEALHSCVSSESRRTQLDDLVFRLDARVLSLEKASLTQALVTGSRYYAFSKKIPIANRAETSISSQQFDCFRDLFLGNCTTKEVEGTIGRVVAAVQDDMAKDRVEKHSYRTNLSCGAVAAVCGSRDLTCLVHEHLAQLWPEAELTVVVRRGPSKPAKDNTENAPLSALTSYSLRVQKKDCRFNALDIVKPLGGGGSSLAAAVTIQSELSKLPF